MMRKYVVKIHREQDRSAASRVRVVQEKDLWAETRQMEREVGVLRRIGALLRRYSKSLFDFRTWYNERKGGV